MKIFELFIGFLREVTQAVLPKNNFGDKIYSYLNFIVKHHGRFPRNRMLFNDYMYKLKVSKKFNTDSLRIYLTDKEFGKRYIKKVLSEEYVIPTYKIFNFYEDFLDYELPLTCVIKPTHLSGQVILKKENIKIDYDLIKKWFATNYYYRSRESNYRDLTPKLIIEEMVFDDLNPLDYKFFCFKGKPKLIQLDHDRYINHTLSLFTPDWVKQNFSITFDQYKGVIKKPNNLSEMLTQVTKLATSTKFDFIRIDAYSNGQKFYFGELTNLHGNAAEIFVPKSGEASASKIIFE